jgi:hypothetical protein
MSYKLKPPADVLDAMQINNQNTQEEQDSAFDVIKAWQDTIVVDMAKKIKSLVADFDTAFIDVAKEFGAEKVDYGMINAMCKPY